MGWQMMRGDISCLLELRSTHKQNYLTQTPTVFKNLGYGISGTHNKKMKLLSKMLLGWQIILGDISCLLQGVSAQTVFFILNAVVIQSVVKGCNVHSIIQK